MWYIKLLFSSRLFTYTAHLTRNFKTDGQNEDVSYSQPGVCSQHVLKILVNLSLDVFIEKVLIIKECTKQ